MSRVKLCSRELRAAIAKGVLSFNTFGYFAIGLISIAVAGIMVNSMLYASVSVAMICLMITPLLLFAFIGFAGVARTISNAVSDVRCVIAERLRGRLFYHCDILKQVSTRIGIANDTRLNVGWPKHLRDYEFDVCMDNYIRLVKALHPCKTYWRLQGVNSESVAPEGDL